jgi:MFS transporter, DHA1 family, inner membrane transport protein
MGFFKNKTFNLIYVHGAFQAFAAYGGESFAFVYLLKAGIPVPIVLCAIGLLFGSRVLFRSAVLPLAKRVGLRNALVCGIVLESLTYPLLSQVIEVGPLLAGYLIMLAISSSFYWTTYHAYVTLIGDSENRGVQVSGLEFVGQFIGIIAPICSGLMLTYFSPLFTFSIVGLAMAASAIPLLFAPNLQIKKHAIIPQVTKTLAWRAMFADGLRAGAFHFTWLIALFITLGQNFASFGGTLALAGMVGAVMGLFVGKSIDLGKGKRALQIGITVLSLAVIARAFGYSQIWSAVLANAVAAVAWPIYATSTNAVMYGLSRKSECPLRFHVIAEGGWDTGTALTCGLSALMIYAGFGFFWPLVFGLAGSVLGYIVLAPTFEDERKVIA